MAWGSHASRVFRACLTATFTVTATFALFLFAGQRAFAEVPQALGALSVSVNPPTADAQDATYTISFVATSGIAGQETEMTIVTPNGTGTPYSAMFTDNTNPGLSNSNICINSGNTSNVWFVGCGGFSANPGDSVTLTFYTVTNPSAPNARVLLVGDHEQ